MTVWSSPIKREIKSKEGEESEWKSSLVILLYSMQKAQSRGQSYSDPPPGSDPGPSIIQDGQNKESLREMAE